MESANEKYARLKEIQDEQLRQNKLVSGRLINVMLPQEVRPFIRACIKQAYLDAMFLKSLLEEGKLDDLADSMTRDLKRYHGGLTFDEVTEAFDLGIRKKYGEYMGISIVAMNDWLNQYKNEPERLLAIKRVRKPELPKFVLPVKTPKQIEEMQKELIDNVIAEYERTGQVLNFGNSIYEFMEREGLIEKDDYKRFIIESKKIRYNELNREKERVFDKPGYNKIIAEMDELMKDDVESAYMKRVAGTHSIIDWIKKQK